MAETLEGLVRGVPLADARAAVEAALAKEGFGVLTEIDVQATLKRKLDLDFRPYVILGACNPALAHRALQTSLDVGVMLPCNVILYEVPEGIAVRAFDPMDFAAREPGLREVATEVRSRLARVVASVSQ